MSPSIRWGVVGPGGIAARFAAAMQSVADGEIVAVSSRSAERAGAFADRWTIERRYDDYDAMLTDDGVDAIYVATPHSRHEVDTVAALDAGKHVLCEKAFALNAARAERMVAHARGRGLFLMDAIWSRFLPAYRMLVDLLGDGRIGEVRMVEADFGFRVPMVDPSHRLFDPAQGGGALLDLGIYPVQLCSLVLGRVEHVVADGVVGTTGVDEEVAAVLHHEGDRLGVVKASLRTGLSCRARIAGTEGSIELPAFHHMPTSLTVVTSAGREKVDAPFDGDGLRFEIAEVHRCLAAGLAESPTMPLDESVAMMATLDAIRAPLGVVYPGEATVP
jgi:predicted dehydrogenase